MPRPKRAPVYVRMPLPLIDAMDQLIADRCENGDLDEDDANRTAYICELVKADVLAHTA